MASSLLADADVRALPIRSDARDAGIALALAGPPGRPAFASAHHRAGG